MTMKCNACNQNDKTLGEFLWQWANDYLEPYEERGEVLWSYPEVLQELKRILDEKNLAPSVSVEQLRQQLATADATIADAALTVQDVLTENRALRQRIVELESMLGVSTHAQRVTIEMLAK